MNQDITFLSDGGNTVRDLQFYRSPISEHFLDWFHITMRLTVMQQLVKGLSPRLLSKHEKCTHLADDLNSVKWFLWHGNTFKALQRLELLQIDVEVLQGEKESTGMSKLLRVLEEFYSCINNNRAFIPNYGERYRHGEIIIQ